MRKIKLRERLEDGLGSLWTLVGSYRPEAHILERIDSGYCIGRLDQDVDIAHWTESHTAIKKVC